MPPTRLTYAVRRPESWPDVFHAGGSLAEHTDGYLARLRRLGEVREPRGIVFHDLSATTVFSTHALPAWTDGELVHVDPLVGDRRKIFLSTLTFGLRPSVDSVVHGYYNSPDPTNVATILAHELTHHLRALADTPGEAGGFEGDFCFYAPRKRLLPDGRYAPLMKVEEGVIA